MPDVVHENLAPLLVPIDSLHPSARNPRRGNIAAIAESLATNGQYRPIVARLDGEIIAGNHTYAAARTLGWDTIAVLRVDVDDEHAARIMLADNRTAELATYDDDALVALLSALDDLSGTGWTDDDLVKMLRLDDASPGLDAHASLAVLVECTDEAQQRDVIARLEADGLTCRALMM